MLLSQKTTIRLNKTYANIIGHMCYAAYKLWNICNYERRNYKVLGLKTYPDWYYQKSHYKDNMWFKALPGQTAQEVCKLLDKAWKSFYVIKKNGKVENPNPPGFKQERIPVTYMQNAIVRENDTTLRLTISKSMKEYMKSEYNIHEKYLYLENKFFKNMKRIKQIKLYPPEINGICRLIIIYEINDVPVLPDNGQYLSIDLGLHNLMTCYDSQGKTFIIGRKYLNICQRYDKEIARVQSQWAKCQVSQGIKYPKISKHLRRLYEKKQNSIRDYLHKVTRYIANYCKENHINTCIIGDLSGIRHGKSLGKVINQQLHALPFVKIYKILKYKLTLYGIKLVKIPEPYTSQCPPTSLEISKKYAKKSNRVERGLYKDGNTYYNADAVGAYNILRKYLMKAHIEKECDIAGIKKVYLVKVAV